MFRVHVSFSFTHTRLSAPGTRSSGGDGGRDLRAADGACAKPLTFVNQPMVRNLAKNISVWWIYLCFLPLHCNSSTVGPSVPPIYDA